MNMEVSEEEVLDALGDCTMSFPQLLSHLVIYKRHSPTICEDAVKMIHELDFPLRETVWVMIADGLLEFTTKREIRKKSV
jgi:hypothetical protein